MEMWSAYCPDLIEELQESEVEALEGMCLQGLFSIRNTSKNKIESLHIL
jgi:hypothetical protein